MVHKILRRAKELRRDEKFAPGHYKKLQKLVLGPDKRVVAGIIRDERKHYKKLGKLITKYEKIGRKIHRKHLPDID